MAKKRGINQNGKPRHLATQANRELVANRVIHGISQDAIAEELGISDVTLRKYYQYELKTARTEKITKIAAKAFALAEEGDPTMIKYVLDKLGGSEWVGPAKQVELTGANGGPIAVQRFDFDAIPIEQTRYLEQVVEAVVVNEETDGEA